MNPSIFNDVIGPVMRGPSSSHCAAAQRLGVLLRDLVGEVSEVHIVYDTKGSLAATHKTQGTDMGLCAGFLGWSADDPRFPDFQKYVNERNISIKIEYKELNLNHPNTFIINISGKKGFYKVKAISVGGGMLKIISLNGTELLIEGDYYELLIPVKYESELKGYLEEFNFTKINFLEGPVKYYQIKSSCPFDAKFIDEIDKSGFPYLKLNPVLPVLSGLSESLPFENFQEMLSFNKGREFNLAELAIIYESSRSGLSEHQVLRRMVELSRLMRNCCLKGLEGTEYEDRILHVQSDKFREAIASEKIEGSIFDFATLFVTAVMESKSAMEVIVAAPTAGSCGVVPGVCLALADHLGKGEEELGKAILAGGLIGVFIAEGATFAAEDAGCMAECGAAAGIAAAAAVYLKEGSLEQCLSASSMALQNSLGMICDPVGNRVEAPCLGKNVMSAMNALSCANMALVGFDALIPLDEVIVAMDKVGKKMPAEHCCTGLGGIAQTPTAKKISDSFIFC